MIRVGFFYAFLSLILFSSALQAKERLGEIRVESLLLKPTIRLQEPQSGYFRFDESLFTLKWILEPNTSAIMKLGSLSLLGEHSLFKDYSASSSSNIGFVEAYGQYDARHGQFKFGRIALPFGPQSQILDEELILPRPIQFSKQVVTHRDVGMAYVTETKNYFVTLAIHNGENGQNDDGQLWYTGLWGWKFRQNLRIGISGQTGETTAISTANGSFNYLGFNKNLNSKYRTGNFFVNYKSQKVYSVFEASMASVEQSDVNLGQLSCGHWDLIYNYSTFGTFILRYQMFDPNTVVDDDYSQEFTIGFAVHNETATSSVIILLSKNIEQPNELVNDELQIIWRLTPYFNE
ncbi:MAG: hypothetical protein KDD50_01495 [Bdellovibrionales bacterium]|nr:hypothetical protein [Bdellovibrionales bacterium]